MRPKVKICGLQKPVDAQYVNDAGADYTGFVYPLPSWHRWQHTLLIDFLSG